MPNTPSPQHKNEICLDVMVVKTEKSRRVCIWLNPKYNEMGNQQPSSEQEKVQRLSKAIGLETQMKIR